MEGEDVAAAGPTHKDNITLGWKHTLERVRQQAETGNPRGSPQGHDQARTGGDIKAGPAHVAARLPSRPHGARVGGRSRSMAGKDFTATLSVDQSPKDVFDAINNVRGW